MLDDIPDTPHGEACQSLKRIDDTLDFQPKIGKRFRDPPYIRIGLKVIAQPGKREPHQSSPTTVLVSVVIDRCP